MRLLSPTLLRCSVRTRSPLLIRARPISTRPTDKWNYNRSPLFDPDEKDTSKFPFTTANELETQKNYPRGVKMLTRDFIEDSLYNPNYGYFSKEATIFNENMPPFEFDKIRNSVEFQEIVAARYAPYDANTQLWHTPTELFKPYYGHAIAQCIVAEYLLKYFPYDDFVIYEIGAGNGTLARNVLDLLRDEYPEVYERTRYTIIEISENLSNTQRRNLAEHDCVEIVNKSVFRWDRREPAPCFFIAMEVIDNFAHDVIRYDLRTLQPYQGVVVVDNEGDLDMVYTPIHDPLIRMYLHLRARLQHELPFSKAFTYSPIRKLYSMLPFAANMSQPEFIPTRMLSLLRTLRTHFPRHRLLLSDFSSLPDAIPGKNAPVVQTRFQKTTIPTETLLVRPGAFDIFFPTDFEQLRDMYEQTLDQPPCRSDDIFPLRLTPLTTNSSDIGAGQDYFSTHRAKTNRRFPIDGVVSASGLPVGEKKSSVYTHAEFLQTYADLGETRLRNGENPMLDFYKNVKFLF
ncbi:DUF185-domain-containing protein [Cylindrobasidium torrendii FP15055 ss-10]|uniref:Protein arginine methyltransferase NDUFAF7 n=1 Tax=Cylindrobasidium torrendii FP15055 ss-10 TaxID=1314674 RepID=A0A0D7B6G5_9AGAR|nr:DUF185-domain-containing protein [Cylindrobasidium torrendii FP15055 ss-10]